jgi:hypothetical protein
MTTADWNKLLKTGFKVPGSHQIYVLGCFARHVTLYSQQVRALNLVYALCKTGKLTAGIQIAVVGGGAAGLTAAAAAAYRGAKVTLLDEVEGPMEMQQNNRQRWVHPYIYDWPYGDESILDQFYGGDANLPLLTWKADYAANVAQEITSQWERLRSAYAIETNWSVRNLQLDLEHQRLAWLKWDGNPGRKFALVILAVGFGLEPKRHGQDSYWTEDDLDGGFRKPSRRPRWLLSGSGDGALTDLMRLCVHRFRQDEMLNLFVTAQGIQGLKQDLRALQENSRTLDEQEVSKRFAGLGIDNELRRLVKEQLRREGPKVALVTGKAHLYGPKTSLLNRLVVRILAEIHPKAFEHVVGTTETVSPKNKVFVVKIRTGGRITIRRPDRVLLRHGPDSKLQRDFPDVHRVCKKMALFWKGLAVNADDTRRPNWRRGYFGPVPKRLPSENDQQWSVLSGGGLPTQDGDFAGSVRRFGVYAESVSILKQIRSDGSSTVTYTINGLSVLQGSVSGVHFRYNSTAGTIDRIKLESRTRGLKWFDDGRGASLTPVSRGNGGQHSYAELIEEARNRARRLSGTVRFPQPLRPNEAISFRLSFRLLNGDALSDWEFFQMYDRDGRRHMDGKRLLRPTEYLARTVWFPTRLLTIRVALPTSIRECVPSVFLFPNHGKISRRDVVKSSVLHFSSPEKKKPRMVAVAKPLRPPFDLGLFRKVSARTWEFSVPAPLVGSCYSIDWPLSPSPSNDFTRKLEEDARKFRRALVRYRNTRRGTPLDGSRSTGSSKCESIAQLFKRLYSGLVEQGGADNRLVVLLLTYVESERRLIVVDGIRYGGDLNPKTWDFWLHFGLGMAGSCFKDGNRAFVLNPQKRAGGASFAETEKDKPEGDRGFYLHIPRDSRPKFLLQIPLDHPRFNSRRCPPSYETSRQCVGVISIASMSGDTLLADIKDPEEFRKLQQWCQGFCQELHDALMGREAAD